MRTMGREQQRTLDKAAAEQAGIPTLLLMEHAAMGIAEVCLEILAEEVELQMVSILTGRGNNGGDGYALARLLAAEAIPVAIYETVPPEKLPDTGDSALNREAARRLGLPLLSATAYQPSATLVVDCVFGTGFKAGRPLTPELKDVFARVEEARSCFGARVLAVDVPSGVDGDSGLVEEGAIQATDTVTFVYPKPGLISYPGRLHAGRVITRGLALPDGFTETILAAMADQGPAMITGEDVAAWRPARPADGHKGSFGHALLYAGEVGYAGAGIMACRSCLSSGTGLVTWMVPAALYPSLAPSCPAAIVRPKPESQEEQTALLCQQAETMSAVLIGPGCGVSEQTAHLVEEGIRRASRLILDADALTVLARDSHLQAALSARVQSGLDPAVLTPHPGEFRRFYPDRESMPESRLDQAADLACRLSAVVVLKGAGTVVAFPPEIVEDGSVGLPRIWINTTGNPGMAKGGSGDVLAGLMTGLCAQDIPLADAVLSAVYIHGLAGDILVQTKAAPAMRMDELPEALSPAFAECGWEL